MPVYEATVKFARNLSGRASSRAVLCWVGYQLVENKAASSARASQLDQTQPWPSLSSTWPARALKSKGGLSDTYVRIS
ncbi:hypothetical protein WJX73_009887 [Symbiochloris irregularis]|uniref:Uncharacterized protein n=1 Tax=Symbiochloris irregularis TaxID=706552 RepID=A0AAW1Q323_9CHLO